MPEKRCLKKQQHGQTRMSDSCTTGESHRIYWQQWLGERQSRRELMTSSVLLKLSSEARAKDVCDLLLSTLNLNAESSTGSLVLVGTLFSLPWDFVRFEQATKSKARGIVAEKSLRALSHEPESETSFGPPDVGSRQLSESFHVIRTLEGKESPLQVRDDMIKHLSHVQQQSTEGSPRMSAVSASISPKLRWYFVPETSSNPLNTKEKRTSDVTSDSTAMLPTWIDLDGYCTSMEEERSDMFHDSDDAVPEVSSQRPWRQGRAIENLQSVAVSHFPWIHEFIDAEDPANLMLGKSQDDWYQQLSYLRASNQEQCCSGFLEKQSWRDRNVWRRMQCFLTDDYLLFVTRVYHGTGRPRYGRIRLTRALLLEPMPEYPVLQGVSNSFEIVTAKGTSHVFRTLSSTEKRRWIQSLSQRISQSFENSLLDSAQLIIADDCRARSGRITRCAAEPLWMLFAQPTGQGGLDGVHTEGAIGAIVRWGLDVAEYRESCRYIHSLLPSATKTVIATESQRAPRLKDEEKADTTQVTETDGYVLDLINHTWTLAEALLARATHAMLQSTSKLSRGFETTCRHVEFVISGHMKKQRSGDLIEPDPPQIDLFDRLLTELQRQVVGYAGSEETEKEIVEAPT